MVPITFNLPLIINIICNNLKCKFCGSNRINKKAQPKQACLISVACRLAKCQLNKVKTKIKNHSPLEGESNEQRFSEVRLVGGLKIMKNLELRIKNLPSAELQRN